jgi:hypothetical protein
VEWKSLRRLAYFNRWWLVSFRHRRYRNALLVGILMIKLHRRDVNVGLIAASLAWGSAAYADDDTGDTGGGGGPGGGTDSSDGSGDNAPPPPDESGIDQDGLIDGNDPYGLDCRSPNLNGDTMTMFQMLGTGTSQPPLYIGVEPGYYASDNSTDGFLDGSQSFLDKALESLKEASTYIAAEVRDAVDYVANSVYSSASGDDGLTVSYGPASEGKGAIGYIGVTPAFVLMQTDANGNNSTTVGVGEEAGVFGTYTEGTGASVGVFAGLPEMAVMASAGVSNGQVVVDVGVIVESPAGDTIEVSREFHPIEALEQTFQQIFGGLEDYRNFTDPMVDFPR